MITLSIQELVLAIMVLWLAKKCAVLLLNTPPVLAWNKKLEFKRSQAVKRTVEQNLADKLVMLREFVNWHTHRLDQEGYKQFIQDLLDNRSELDAWLSKTITNLRG